MIEIQNVSISLILSVLTEKHTNNLIYDCFTEGSAVIFLLVQTFFGSMAYAEHSPAHKLRINVVIENIWYS